MACWSCQPKLNQGKCFFFPIIFICIPNPVKNLLNPLSFRASWALYISLVSCLVSLLPSSGSTCFNSEEKGVQHKWPKIWRQCLVISAVKDSLFSLHAISIFLLYSSVLLKWVYFSNGLILLRVCIALLARKYVVDLSKISIFLSSTRKMLFYSQIISIFISSLSS